MNGNRIAFSCTWNEKRKKDKAEAIRVYPKVSGFGDLKVDTRDGKQPRNVNSELSLSKDEIVSTSRSLMTRLAVHQKLATLSSKRPRATGKMR